MRYCCITHSKMAQDKFKASHRWFFSLQIILYLFTFFVEGIQEKDEAYANGKNLVLEFFLPINLPNKIEIPSVREKRDLEEGSGDEPSSSEINEKNNEWKNAIESKQNEFGKLFENGEVDKTAINVTDFEGSGEIYDVREDDNKASSVPLIGDSEMLTTTSDDLITDKENKTRNDENHNVTTIEETTTEEKPDVIYLENGTTEEEEETTLSPIETVRTESYNEVTTVEPEKKEVTVDTATVQYVNVPVTTPSYDIIENATSESAEFDHFAPEVNISVETVKDLSISTTTIIPDEAVTGNVNLPEAAVSELTVHENTTAESSELPETSTVTTTHNVTPIVLSVHITTEPSFPEEPTKMGSKEEEKELEIVRESTTSVDNIKPFSETETLTIEPPVIETKMAHKTVEALPGNILQKKNLTLGVDPLLIITNTGAIESDDADQMNSGDSRKLGAYIVIGLILLSFSTLVGYIMFRKMKNRKRQNFDGNPESNDTEKALLSLSDYKDNSELEENHLKNNEITPIVVKSNSQINKFEKNTNFSSPKNLNTIANEKYLEKDNVLKSTAENLTQVIIEETLKDYDEDKSSSETEKVIVKTRIDQDSIPKKPIIINRSSTGYMPIPTDSV